jgi:predicted O-methyltransferase YrrM
MRCNPASATDFGISGTGESREGRAVQAPARDWNLPGRNALCVFANCRPDATVVSIDFSTTALGNFYRAFQKPLFRKFVRKGQSLVLLRKDSHKPETLDCIRKALGGQKLDFLFIDGDHSYEGARRDFEMYAPLVRSGGLVAFHDITPCGPPKEVYKVWNEVKGSYVHKEFIHQTGKGSMGIGVLWA